MSTNNPQTYCYNTIYLPNQNVIDKNIINLGSCILENPSSPTGCYTNFVNDVSALSTDSNFNNITNSYQSCIANNQPTTAPTTTPTTESNNTGLIVGIFFAILIVIILAYFIPRQIICSKSISQRGYRTNKFFCKGWDA